MDQMDAVNEFPGINAGPDEQIWYYTAVTEVLTRRRPEIGRAHV